MPADDPFNLQRFVTAQEPIFETALQELQAGRKQSHWMWFIFPQLRDLGHSPTAQFFGIGSRDEARAYLAHPVLGPRLALCVRTIEGSKDGSLHAIFGSPDDMKFQSSMTLFSLVAPNTDNPFRAALDHWCAGCADARTLALLHSGKPSD